MVDAIETGFLADWMPARKMEGREARCLATAKKSMFPVWISLKRERCISTLFYRNRATVKVLNSYKIKQL